MAMAKGIGMGMVLPANITPPNVLDIFHPILQVVSTTQMTINTRSMMLVARSESSPSVPMAISPMAPPDRRGWRHLRSHGNGKPTATSKMLEPNDDDTAISPKPLRATNTLVNTSGTDVPTAESSKGD